MLWCVLGAGALAIFLSPKTGISLAVLFGAMIGFAQNLMTYSVEIGWASMALGAMMVAYVLWINRTKLFTVKTALKEVVIGNEVFKNVSKTDLPTEATLEAFKTAQIGAQKSPATTELVSAIRNELSNTK